MNRILSIVVLVILAGILGYILFAGNPFYPVNNSFSASKANTGLSPSETGDIFSKLPDNDYEFNLAELLKDPLVNAERIASYSYRPVDLLIRIATKYHEKGNNNKAEVLLIRAQKEIGLIMDEALGSFKINSLCDVAALYYKMGKKKEAIAILNSCESMVDKNTKGPKLYVNGTIAVFYSRIGEHQKSLNMLNELYIRLKPDFDVPATKYNLFSDTIDFYVSAGFIQEAIDIIKKDKNDPYMIAGILIKQGRLEEAQRIIEYEKDVERRNWILKEIAMAYAKLGKAEQALKYLSEWDKQYQLYIYFEIINWYLTHNEQQKAIGFLGTSIKILDESEHYYYYHAARFGHLYYLAGEKEKGELLLVKSSAHIDALFEIMPNDDFGVTFEELLEMLRIYIKHNQDKLAFGILNRKDSNQVLPGVLNDIAKIYAKNGDYKKADQVLRKVADKSTLYDSIAEILINSQ